jgi:hypothetical protein
MLKKRKRRKKISEDEKEEIKKSVELAELVKPDMENGLDVTLFTQMELDRMNEMQEEHNQLFRKRAEELRFYPDTLNRKERSAVLRCMNYQELKPYYGILAIHEKNRRLQSMLALEKVDIRRYCRMTLQFGKSGYTDEFDLPNLSIANNTEKYFSIMRERGEKTYETKYYFLTKEHRKKVLEIYAKSVSNVELAHLDQVVSDVDGD